MKVLCINNVLLYESEAMFSVRKVFKCYTLLKLHLWPQIVQDMTDYEMKISTDYSSSYTHTD